MRWAENDKEKKHVTDTLLKATHTAGKVAKVMMKDGTFKQGMIYKSGTHLSEDKTTNCGYIILEDSNGFEEQLDVLDVQHIQ